MKFNPASDRSSRTGWLAIPATLFMGALSSSGAFFAIRRWERVSRRIEEKTLSRQEIELLRTRMLGLMEILHSLAAYYRAAGPFTRDSFSRFVDQAIDRHPSILAITWNPWVRHEERDVYEARGRDELLPDFQFREHLGPREFIRARKRRVYVPVFYIRPLQRNLDAVGFDLASEPARRKALERARDTGEPAATAPLRLVQEPEDQLGYLVLVPIYRVPCRTVAERRKNLLGFAAAAFRVNEMVESSAGVGVAERRNMALEIYDHARGLVYRHPAKADALAKALRASGEELTFAGGRWNVVVKPASRPTRWQSWAVLGAGLVFTTVVLAFIWSALRRRAEVERKVVLRTRDLSDEISVRRSVEAHLREAERKYRSIFENSIEGIFQTSPNGRYLSANPALARLYGYASPEELMAELGNVGERLYLDPDRRDEFIRAVRNHGAVSDFESQVRRRDGALIWIRETAREVRGKNGQVLYYEGTVQDITERKSAEEALRIANERLEARVLERTAELAAVNEALLTEIRERRCAEDAAESASRAKSAFLAHMSHEIRTPLNAILGYAQILQRDDTLAQSQREAVETIASSGVHLFELVDDILDLSKIEAGRMELQNVIFDLRELIDRIEAMFRHRCAQQNLELAVQVKISGPRQVQGDQGKLRQVLINLLENSVKFTDVGRVTLRVEEKCDCLYRFEVLDTGPGISEEAKKEIFEPFFRSENNPNRPGAGLGLTIARRCIRMMGGELELDSAPGRGSRFFFSLKLASVQRDEEPIEPSGSRTRLSRGCSVKALVVDDVRENREVLERMLEAIGCETRRATDGESAIRETRAWDPDIVFMDVWMPGMNGIEAATVLLGEKKGIRFVAHSASAFDHEQKRYLDAGFDDFFAKPFRWDRLCHCLEKQLGVTFETVAMEGAPLAGNLPRIALPAAVVEALLAAAEVNNITGLREQLAVVSALGPEGERVAQQFSIWMNCYEMDRISAYVREQAIANTVS